MAQLAQARQAFARVGAKLRLPEALAAPPKRLTRYRILESPGCRRIVLTHAPSGNGLDLRASESLSWKLQAWEDNYMVKVSAARGHLRSGARF
jgi:hypothetical protein